MDTHRKKTCRSQGETARPIIGVGGSARDLAEVRRFLRTLKLGCGAAFVLVLHREPDDEGGVSALATSCALPVVSVPAGSGTECVCEPDRVYIVASDTLPTIEAGRLRFGALGDAHAYRAPIDRFFVSLAEDQEDNAACVVLSGTGGDGTVGARAIKVHGGIVLAQSDAGNGGVTVGSPAVALADLVMPIDAIEPRLQEHFDHRASLLAKDALAGIRAAAGARLDDFCDILRVRTGHDFSGFKSGTVTRQVQRRMHLHRISDADAFLSLLKADPSEADHLFRDLLIGLTEFFHNRKAFEVLERDVVPRILAGKGPGDAVRVWVPGCATGEEAYAIAMLLCEQAGDGEGPQIQIFASDIDDRSLASARRGRYPASIEEFVSGERLIRFFIQEGDTYRVTGALRDRCLFTKHDLLRDPPFSRIDLIVCRNVLIHFDPEMQKQVVAVLHYAMREGGYLFLGESENATDGALFETIDPEYRIFRKRACGRTLPPKFPISARAPAEHEARARSATGNGNLVARAEHEVLEHFSPAHAVINSLGDIIHASARTGAFLEMPAGAPDNNIFSLARPGLRQELRAAFHEATARHQTVTARNITVRSAAGGSMIDLIVQPLDGTDVTDPSYLVAFRVVGDAPVDGSIEAVENAGIRQLEMELRATRETLQTTTEELESSNEELRSANEEMSSLNEELQAVNAELNVRIDELSSSMNDVVNLFESTQIATIFLDRELRLRFFTPAACDLYHLVQNDLGRPITDLRPRFASDPLPLDAGDVLRTLTPVERLVSSTDGDQIFLMRILPYHTANDAVEGLVLTFVEQRPFNSMQ